jgi:hypothetical protein
MKSYPITIADCRYSPEGSPLAGAFPGRDRIIDDTLDPLDPIISKLRQGSTGMNCSKCGADVQEESRFCPKCGARLDTSDDLQATVTVNNPLTETTSVRDRLVPPAARESADESATNIAGDDLWTGTYSPKAMIGVWIALAVVTLILLIVAISRGEFWWTVFLYATPAIWIGGVGKLFYNQWSVSYSLTSKRFTHEHGLLRRVTDRIEVIDMDDVSVSQGLVERFTGTGTIKIVSSDRSHPEFYIRGIDNAVALGTQMDDARRAERERRGLHIEAI